MQDPNLMGWDADGNTAAPYGMPQYTNGPDNLNSLMGMDPRVGSLPDMPPPQLQQQQPQFDPAGVAPSSDMPPPQLQQQQPQFDPAGVAPSSLYPIAPGTAGITSPMRQQQIADMTNQALGNIGLGNGGGNQGGWGSASQPQYQGGAARGPGFMQGLRNVAHALAPAVSMAGMMAPAFAGGGNSRNPYMAMQQGRMMQQGQQQMSDYAGQMQKNRQAQQLAQGTAYHDYLQNQQFQSTQNAANAKMMLDYQDRNDPTSVPNQLTGMDQYNKQYNAQQGTWNERATAGNIEQANNNTRDNNRDVNSNNQYNNETNRGIGMGNVGVAQMGAQTAHDALGIQQFQAQTARDTAIAQTQQAVRAGHISQQDADTRMAQADHNYHVEISKIGADVAKTATATTPYSPYPMNPWIPKVMTNTNPGLANYNPATGGLNNYWNQVNPMGQQPQRPQSAGTSQGMVPVGNQQQSRTAGLSNAQLQQIWQSQQQTQQPIYPQGD
jgi:hypothetical protein